MRARSANIMSHRETALAIVHLLHRYTERAPRKTTRWRIPLKTLTTLRGRAFTTGWVNLLNGTHHISRLQEELIDLGYGSFVHRDCLAIVRMERTSHWPRVDLRSSDGFDKRLRSTNVAERADETDYLEALYGDIGVIENNDDDYRRAS